MKNSYFVLFITTALLLFPIILPLPVNSSETPEAEESLIVAQSLFCPNEYCEPDPKAKDFFRWMRDVGYQECLIGRYAKEIDTSQGWAIIKRFLDKRPMG